MFAEILRRLRKKRNLSQKQFAKEVYISPAAVSQYETGRTMPSRDTLERIAKYFNVSTDYLLGSSPISEIEELMNQDYCVGVTVSALVDKCMSVKGKNREALLVVVDALEMYSESQDK